MNAEFVDTNVLVYAHSPAAGLRYERAVDLMTRLANERTGILSTQVLTEFYVTVTGKLRMKSDEAEAVVRDLAGWMVHRPSHADIIEAIRIQRRYKLSWWDSLIVRSAMEMGAETLWTEDLTDGQKFARLTVRNPFG